MSDDAIILYAWRVHRRAGWSVKRHGSAKPIRVFRSHERMQAAAFGVRLADRMGVPLEVRTEDGQLEAIIRPEGQSGPAGPFSIGATSCP